jgi:hypothetical protein
VRMRDALDLLQRERPAPGHAPADAGSPLIALALSAGVRSSRAAVAPSRAIAPARFAARDGNATRLAPCLTAITLPSIRIDPEGDVGAGACRGCAIAGRRVPIGYNY